VPESGLSIYKNVDIFRDINIKLDHIVGMYNHLMQDLLDVERPLLEKKINAMDSALKPGLETFKWESNDIIKQFINPAMQVVKTSFDMMCNMHNNMDNIESILSNNKKSLIEKSKKTMLPGDFLTQHQAMCESFLVDMGKDLKKVHDEHKKTLERVKSSVDKDSNAWRAYMDYVNERVINGLCNISSASFDKLCELINPKTYEKHDVIPLFEIKADIENKNIQFEPEFDFNEDGNSICDIVNSWICDFMKVSTLITRVDSVGRGVAGGDYLNEVSENFKIKKYLYQVSLFMSRTRQMCEDYKHEFNE